MDVIVPSMVKKACDTNEFISLEADHALITMCENCGEHKTLNSLFNNKGNSPQIKAKVAMCLEATIIKMGSKVNSCRDLDKIFQLLATFLDVGHADVRQ